MANRPGRLPPGRGNHRPERDGSCHGTLAGPGLEILTSLPAGMTGASPDQEQEKAGRLEVARLGWREALLGQFRGGEGGGRYQLQRRQLVFVNGTHLKDEQQFSLAQK